MDCHTYEGDGAFVLEGPEMTGYGSRGWLVDQIKNGESHYGSEMNEMPKFEDDLDAHDIAMVAAYLRQQRFAKPDFTVPAANAEADAKE
jgi:mono/diheme cytochrome c family protein